MFDRSKKPLQRVRCSLALLWICSVGTAASESADSILAASDVRGGLIVHLGCGNGRLTAALRTHGGYLVHGLDTDPERIATARTYIQSLGVYGKVSVDRFDGESLPYRDNLVNLLVADELGEVSMKEVMRVLAPLGVACVDGNQTVKPWPKEIDEWTHYLHGPDNNAVARDQRVGPPRNLQWLSGPAWARHHDGLAHISGLVSSRGRIFYVIDEGPTSLMHVPARWRLVARDGFSGVLLWKRIIPRWESHLRYFRTGPTHLPRRLVAVGDRVYATLGYGEPVSVLDAASGRTMRTLPGTENTEEMICYDDLVLAVIHPDQDRGRRLVAVDTATGATRWTAECDVSSLTLAASDDRVFFQSHGQVVCADVKTGAERWRSLEHKPGGRRGSPWYAPTLVVAPDVVLVGDDKKVTALSAETGEVLWTNPIGSGFLSPSDLFVVNGLAWFTGAKSHFPVYEGRNLKTGVSEQSVATKQVWTGGHHHRCYRNKATERFIMTSKRGLEFLDLVGDRHARNNWVRGICQYGIMPCNGLTYAPPHPCMCFAATKLNGFYALAAQHGDTGIAPPVDRCERGPAYALSKDLLPPPGGPSNFDALSNDVFWRVDSITADTDWPMLRHDAARSGGTRTALPGTLNLAWRTEPGSTVTAPVSADGVVFVALPDRHAVQALDAETGGKRWTFTAGGRVDSPPTLYGRLAVFGSSDGSVYCVRSDTGELVWRRFVAPRDRRVVSYDQVESAWPVHGSVLVRACGGDGNDAMVYAAAGRSGHLDGGIHVCAIDLSTGELRYRTCAVLPHQVGREATVKSGSYSMEGILADVLVANGSGFCMRQTTFNEQCEIVGDDQRQVMFAVSGLLDGACDHRSFWVLGGRSGRAGLSCNVPRSTGDAPYAKMFVFDAKYAYGFRLGYDIKGRMTPSHHQDFSAYRREAFPVGGLIFSVANRPALTNGTPVPAFAKSGKTRERRKARWAVDTTLQVRAMLLAADRLFVAGWRDSHDPTVAEDALLNRKGGALLVLSVENGRKLAEIELASAPAWDGMIAAGGRLYLSDRQGSVSCYKAAE
jgi:outer membrane protein assembly factor BamB